MGEFYNMDKPRFRRRKDRLKWHTNAKCPKWPVKDFVEDEPTGPMGNLMVCSTCIGLDKKDEDIAAKGHSI